jgi:glycosyltransferase involved in cell wall biosynthesis
VKDTYGITSGLFNSASFVVSFLTTKGYEAQLSPVIDANGIDRVVTQYDPDVVIIEALWVPPAKFQELLSIPRHKKRKWIVRIHSKAPFLANEGLATRWIHQYTQVTSGTIFIAPNTLELTEQLSTAFPHGNFIFLPNIYFPKKFKPQPRERDPYTIHVGCFGAIRPMKNTYQQALAAIAFAEDEGKKLFFHINGTRVEQKGENVIKNIRALFEDSPHELVEHKWYHHDEFLEVASKMDVGMQVSFSESFNIVTADMVTAGVPVVASDDIEWMPRLLKVSPTKHRKMVNKIGIAHRIPMIAKFLQTLRLKVYNFKAKMIWLVALTR